MARPEGETTRLLRETMDLNLDAVNEKLLEAGEKAIDASALAKRRSWIRAKPGGKGKSKAGKSKGFSKLLGKKPATGAKTKTKRKSRAPVLTPREGTFAHHVWRLPYDMEVKEVIERARAAKIMKGNSAQVYKIRTQYPEPKRTPKLNHIASTAALRAEDARKRAASQPEAIGSALTGSPSETNASVRSLFTLLVLRIGVDDAEARIRDIRQAQSQLEATLGKGQ